MVMPFGTIIDTNWIGDRLGPNMQGLTYHKKLAGICWNEDHVYGPKYFTDKLNEKFKKLTGRVYSQENPEDLRPGKEAMAQAGVVVAVAE